MSSEISPLEGIDRAEAALVGGKALRLGQLIQAGLPVPPGFCITTAPYLRLRGRSPRDDPTLRAALAEAYHRLGDGPVAVRSSATVEDSSAASFAGQQVTFLGVTGEAALLDAVARCWASLDAQRAVAYRRWQGVGEQGLAMAVVVQRLVPAEVAGVLFTRDPLDPDGRRMLVEASWGLGESVVSGRVTPDRFYLKWQSGAVLDRQVSSKPTMMMVDGPQPVPAAKRDQPCLDDWSLAELAELGRRVEALAGAAQDVEWAWAEGRFWLLQARPITGGSAAEREQVRREEVAALAARAEPGGTVWSRFNLSEVLPAPTPMSWAVVRRLMAGDGGFGLMLRDLGFDPDPALDKEGIFDLVCGRPYCNLSREPRMHFRSLPFEHPFAVLKAVPQKALYPQPVLNPARLGWSFWLLLPIRLPALIARITCGEMRRRRLSRSFARRFREEVIPAFTAEVDREAGQDLSRLDTALLIERLEFWIRRTLCDFARESLKPTTLAAFALGRLERQLAKSLGAERTRTALRELVMGVAADPEADLAGAVWDLLAGRLPRDLFLRRFGHRGRQEMELAEPRWAEDPAALDAHLSQPAAPSPREASADRWPAIAAEARLSPPQEATLRGEVEALRGYLGLRETGKHYLMKGYTLIRRILIELDRRFQLGGGIFYLTPDDLRRLVAGEDLRGVIAQARRRRTLALSLEAPPVLFSDDLEAIGRPVPVQRADCLQGVPLSAGVAEGPALVLREPSGAVAALEPYILVCPSTDPAWVPLFVRAGGLVMETGGVLSHGAIVAREFGLPAVAGLPDVVHRLHTGQRLRVDGGRGTVVLMEPLS
jgi:pyruvate,water dikinase